MTISGGPASATIRARFGQDHQEIEELLRQLLLAFEADDRARVGALWSVFDAQLLAHLDAEEKHLVPRLLRANERAARSILEEHRHIRSRLTELGTQVDLHLIRLPAARAFIDELRAHARHEDQVLYEWADAEVSEAEKHSLFGELSDVLKARLLARASVVAS
ncbi:MAG TPA: hemerythrin domain-containing protein [Polyangiaceae bacterium]|nr:hemerythrin domain-containing protein [Polyangiaceae bacterium]